jgi:hypothetical protein
MSNAYQNDDSVHLWDQRRFVAWKIACAIALVIAVLYAAALPVGARNATHDELLAFSREVANDSRLVSVEIGGGYVEESWAVASWRSVDGKRRGQAVFFHLCDHWNLAETKAGVFTRSDLSRLHRVQPLTPKIAALLEADSIKLQRAHTAYLPPSHRTPTC